MKRKEQLIPANDLLNGVFYSVGSQPHRPSQLDEARATGSVSSNVVGICSTSLGRRGKQWLTEHHTVFTPAFLLEMPDEIFVPKVDTTAEKVTHCPGTLRDAISAYDDWLCNQSRSAIPDLVTVTDTLCTGRVSWSFGLGGVIFFEHKSDAMALIDYYSADYERC